jgi:DNA-binding LacI/PurR family transcriptional regulator
MQKLGLRIDEQLVGPGDFHDESAFRETRRMLNTPKPPTAIYCANDLMAIGAIRAIQDSGLRVPDDIAVVGFDDLETGRYIDVPVTTVKPPVELAAVKAFAMMMDIMRDPNRPPQQIRLPCELIVRASTVKPLSKR